MFLLRGNHETAQLSRTNGFYDECKRRYNLELCKIFIDVFNCMPVAAIIGEKIFCMHGGLSPDLTSMEQIRRIMRPTDASHSSRCFMVHAYISCVSYLTLVCCVTYYGATLLRKSSVGMRTSRRIMKMKTICHSLSVQMLLLGFYKSMTWI
jgi:hypothetical protein